MDVRVLTTIDEVAAIGGGWDDVGNEVAGPIVSHDWVMAGLEHLRDDRAISVVTLWSGSDLVAAAPLVRTEGPLGRLEFVGQMDHAEPGGFAHSGPESLTALVGALADLRVPFFLRGLPAETITALTTRLRGWRVRTRAYARCPVLAIPSDAAMEILLSKSLRSDLRRARRRAGNVSFEMHIPTSSEDLDPLWADLVRIEAAGWKGRSGTALHHQEALARFYAGYARRAAGHKALRLGLLSIDGTTAAAVMAVELDDRLWLLKTGYDESFSAASPGNLALEETVSYSAAHGLRAIEFLGESAPWTRRWTSAERPRVSVRAYPPTSRGWARLAVDGARALTSRLRGGDRS